MPTSSVHVALGTPCPEFDLPSVDGGRHRLSDFAEARALVCLFICNHCPYVLAVEDRILALVREFTPRGAQFVGICSNDAGSHPEDAPERLRERWERRQFGFPYLVDEAQDVARRFQAACTPDIFVYGRERRLVYRGRIDDHWQEAERVRRRDLAEALESILAGRSPDLDQSPSMGCSIKWRQR